MSRDMNRATRFQGSVACLWADLWAGRHRPEHEYRLALYDNGAGIDAAIEHYTPKGEVEGLGYEAGGRALTHRRVGEGTLTFAAPEWPRATLRNVDTALLYNKSSGRAIAIYRFDPTSCTNGPFGFTRPVTVMMGRSSSSKPSE